MARSRDLSIRPQTEPLEERCLLSAVWTGAGDGINWSDNRNWQGLKAPVANDDVFIGNSAPVNVSTLVTISSLTATGPLNISHLHVASSVDFAQVTLGGALSVDGSISFGTLDYRGGELTAKGGVTINGTSTWSGGKITASSITNHGDLTLPTVEYKFLDGPLTNTGTISISGATTISITSAIASITNQAGATIDFQADASLLLSSSSIGGVSFFNSGTLEKTAGSGTSTINFPVIDTQPIFANSGTLALTAGGTFTGSTVTGGGTVTLAGSVTGDLSGSGPGAVKLGTIDASAGGLSLNFAGGTLQWTGGTLTGPITNLGTLNATAGDRRFAGTFTNAGSLVVSGAGFVGAGASNTSIVNRAGATIDYRADSSLRLPSTSYTGVTLVNSGTFKKSGGTGNLPVDFAISGAGTFESDSGTIQLSGGGSGLDASFLAGGGIITLAGTYSGALKGSGTGSVQVNNVSAGAGGLSFDFAGATLQWTGNTLAGPVTNLGGLSLTTANSKTLTGTLTNAGTIAIVGSGIISVPNSNTSIVNRAGAVIDFRADSSILAGNSTLTNLSFVNAGTIKKTGGTGTSTITLRITDSGTIDADSGTIAFTAGGSFANAIVNAQGSGVASLSGAYTGSASGSGTGAVKLGTIDASAGGLSLNFAGGTLQWTGGTLTGPITNLGTLNATAGDRRFAGTFTNAGSLVVSGAGFVGAGASNTSIVNRAGATIDYRADSSLRLPSTSYTGVTLVNSGTFKKSGGTGNLPVDFAISGAGTFESDSGTIQLSGGGSGLDASFLAGGGIITLAGTYSGALKGSGTGSVQVNNVSAGAGGLSFDFAGATLQWTGNTLAGPVTNLGGLSLTTANSKTLTGTLTNAGTIAIVGSGIISVPNSNTSIVNRAGAVIDFRADSSILAGNSTLTNLSFVNAGTIKKTGGTGTSTITLPLSSPTGSTGTINDVETGTLLFSQGTLAVDGSGYLSSRLAGTLAIGGNLVGNTTNSSLSNFFGTLKLTGAGKAASPQLFEVMGQDLGPITAGFANNFAYTGVTIAQNNYVRLTDNSNNVPGSGAEALYVNSLVVSNNATLDLNGLHVYVRNVQVAGGVINGTITQLPPGPIILGAPVSGSIKTASQADSWTVFGRAGESLAIAVSTGASGAPAPPAPNLNFAQVQLIDPNGHILATASNSVSGANVILSIVTLAADGLYQIKVANSPAHSTSTGNYILTVDDATIHTMTASPNQILTGQLGSISTTDQWTFSAQANQLVQFHMIGLASPTIQFSLTGPGGDVVSTLSASSDPITLPFSGTYTLNVTGGIGAYSFRIDQVSQTPLVLDTTYTGTLGTDGYAQLFALPVVKAGPLVVTLHDTKSTDRVELYAKIGSPPTRQTYDATGTTLGPDQTVTIPFAAPGTWYFLVYGAKSASGSTFTLKATQPGLILSSISPTQSVAGTTTVVALNGFEFQPGMQVMLKPAAGGSPLASTSLSINSTTQATATFDLTGIAAGNYSVTVTLPDGRGSTLAGAFQVAAAGQAHLETNLILPSTLGRHVPATLYIEYANTGNAPMPAPILILDSGDPDGSDHPILTLDQNLLTTGLWATALPPGVANSVQILAGGATPGILQPGERVRVPVYYGGLQQPWNFSDNRIELEIGVHDASDETAIDWSTFQRPDSISAAAWPAVLANLQAQIGTTWGDYTRAISADATYLSRLGETVTDIGKLYNFEVQKAIGLDPVGSLASATDAAVAAPGLSLEFDRVFGNTITTRSQSGPFGLGWDTNWGMYLEQQSGGVVIVHETSSSERVFVPDSRSTTDYLSQPGDPGTLVKQGDGSFLLTETTGYETHYRADGKLDYVQDIDGNRITAGYTGNLLTSLTHSAGGSLTITYNVAGHISSMTDSAGHATIYQYDSTNTFLLSATGPGGTTSYTYSMGEGIAKQYALLTVTGTDGLTLHYQYDARGRLAAAFLDGNAQRVDFAYANGEVTSTDATGIASHAYLDYRGLAVRTEDALGHYTLYTYNDAGQLIKTTDQLGRSVTYTRCDCGRPKTITDVYGNTILTYTLGGPNNDPVAMTDAKGNVTRYSYDTNGNVTAVTYADGTVESITLDSQGNPTSTTNRRGETTSITNNLAGQILYALLPDGSTLTYSYDSRGRLHTATDSSGTITLSHDDADDLTRVDYPDGRWIAYAYDAVGDRTRIEDSSGFAEPYVYNSLGQLVKLLDKDGGLIDKYTYDAAGRLIREDKGNGTYTVYGYDAGGRNVSIVNLSPGGSINSQFLYTYDAAGDIATETTSDGTWTYSYDLTDQLTHAVFASTNPAIPAQDLGYQYDALGNRIKTIINGVTTSYTTNTMNQYTSAGGTTYQHDADGNLVQESGPDGLKTYTYDSLNRLTQVVTPQGNWQYEYDALGDRSAVIANGVRTEYLIDPTGLGSVIGAYDSSGYRTQTYSYGYGLVDQETSSGRGYYDYDLIGSTVGMSEDEGRYGNRYSFDPIGRIIFKAGSADNPFSFVGRSGVMDDNSGLYYMRAREYDPMQGRFTGEDPLRLNGGEINFYKYVKNNYVARIDPSGLFTKQSACETGVVGAFTVFGGLGSLVTRHPGAGLVIGGLAGLGAGMAAAHLGCDPRMLPSLPIRISRPSPAPYTHQMCMDLVDSQNEILGDKDNFPNVGGPLPLPAECEPFRDYPLMSIAPKLPHSSANFSAVRTAGASDPNDKLGAAGFGEQAFIAADTPIPYRVDFENAGPGTTPKPKVIATAPAQRVEVTDQLTTNLDWSTFRFTEFGFGDNLVTVTGNGTYFADTVIMTYNGKTFDVDVELNFDVRTGKVRAVFQSTDPSIGLPPDALTGFLPPEDGTGRGQGHIGYVVTPVAGLPTGTEIRNVASIIFDFQPAITTDQIDDFDPSAGVDLTRQALNTIDAGTPTSRVDALPTTTGATSFAVSWSGADDDGGSDIAYYDVYSSDNGGSYAIWQADTTLTSATFTGQFGHTYRFYSIATDNVGNAEAAPGSPDATIQLVSPTTSVTVQPSEAAPTYGDSLTFTGTVASSAGAPGTPTGTIQFLVDGSAFGTPVTLIGGVATSGSIASLGAGTHTVSASYSGDPSFSGSTADVLALSVAKAALTIAADHSSKVYGQANPGLTATYTGFVNGDTAASLSTAPALTTAATKSSPVGSYTVTVSGASADNYDITYADGALDVTKASLTIRANNASKVYGQANPAFTAGYIGFVNGDSASSLATQPTLTTTATTASAAGTYAITAGGASANNYDISYQAGNLTITKAALTIKAIDATKVYGQANPSFTATYTGFFNGDDASNLTTPVSLVSAATPASGVGAYAITASGATSNNYTIFYQAGSLAVTKASLTIQADDKTKLYGQAIPPLTATYTGFVNGDAESSLTTLPSFSTMAIVTSPVGNYSITVSGAASANYSMTYVPGTLAVTIDSLATTTTLAAIPAAPTYGDLLTFTATVAAISSGAGTPTGSVQFMIDGHDFGKAVTLVNGGAISPVISTLGAGSHTIRALYSGDATFPGGDADTLPLVIAKAALTVKADDKMKVYGQDNPTLTATYTGFVNGDTAGSLTKLPTLATTGATSGAGRYDITASGAGSDNYTISYQPGTLIVTKASLKIDADDASRVYGQANPAFTATYIGFVNGDSASSLATQPTLTTTATTASAAGTYAITASGATSSNYDITDLAGTLTIAKAALTIKADDQSRPYGKANRTLTATYEGFVTGDTPANLTVPATLATIATATSFPGSYPITVVGASSGNYTISYQSGSLTVVVDSYATTTTVKASPVAPVYGDALTLTATVAADSPVAGTPTGTVQFFVDGSTFGSPALLVGGVASSGSIFSLGAGSHTVSALYSGDSAFTNHSSGSMSVTIAKASLVVKADDKTKIYGQANPILTANYSGFVNGDTVSSLTRLPSLSTAASLVRGVGGYDITASGASASNYDITYQPGILAITKAHLTVTADNKVMGHGDGIPSLTASLTGFVNGDNASAVGGSSILSTTATAASLASTYAITVATGSLIASNYDFTLVPGTLTVHPKVVDVRVGWGSQSMSILGLNRDLPFSTIEAIDIIFSDDVSVDAADLALASTVTAGKTYSMSGFSYNPGTHDARWTMPNALDIDKLVLKLDGDAAGHDGAHAAGGIYLGTYAANFSVLPGDFNGDNTVDSLDLVAVRNGILGILDHGVDVWADINGDGKIDINDYNTVKKYVGKRF